MTRPRYVVEAPARVFGPAPGAPGIVLPEVPHRVEPLGPVRFHVGFLRAGDESA